MSDGNRQIESIPPEMIAVAVNRTMLFLAVLTVTVIFFIASFQPRPILLPAMSGLLTLCAIAASILAIIRVQPFGAPYLTFWDVSALWLLLALGLGLLTDTEAVEAYLAATTESAAPAAQPAAPPPPPATN